MSRFPRCGHINRHENGANGAGIGHGVFMRKNILLGTSIGIASLVAGVAIGCLVSRHADCSTENAAESHPSENARLLPMITVEEHFSDQRVMAENAKFQKPVELTPEQKQIREFFASRMFLTDDLTDTDQQRLKHMDETGVGIQILSYTTPVTDQVPAEDAVRICRMANDILAERVKAHPDRYRAMATLPMADPEAAAAELERTVKELGFVGVLLAGQYQGHWYDEHQFLPIFAKAAELDVPVYFHPYLINPEVQQAVYMSSAYSPIVGAEFSSAGLGWHLDTGIAIVRLILAGIFDKYPNLKFVSGHWGEGIPMMLDRMDYQLTTEMTGLKHPVSYYYKEHVYITPSGIMSYDNLYTMIKVMGADHIIYSEDYPYYKPENFSEFLREANISQEEKDLIARKNAEKLYKLSK